MKNLLKLEELAQLLVCVCYLLINYEYYHLSWWVFALMLIGPDVGMLGYAFSPRVGAFTYNLLHHKGIALAFIAASVTGDIHTLMASTTPTERALFVTGIVLYGHASMDRIFGYGLKFGDSFQHTHLGWIGKLKAGSGQ